MLTNERAELIGNYLTADKERAAALLALSPEEAVAKMNADGNDFTVEEIIAFGATVRTVSAEEGELGADDLDDVSGGSVTLVTLLGVTFATKVAYDVGKVIGKNAPW